MLYTAFYGWVLAGQESSLVLHVLAATHGWGHGASSGRRGRWCSPWDPTKDCLAARKPGRDSSRGVADERCSMR